MTIQYKSEAEVEGVVKGLESCSTGKDDFPHYKHLVVAVCYLRDLTPDQAFAKMRESLLRFIEHHDIDRNIYKEELTKAWINLVAEELERLDASDSLLTKVNTVMECLSDKDAVFNRYPDNAALQRERTE